MTANSGKDDYVRTDELRDALIPISTAPDLFRVSRKTIYEWIKADSVPITTAPGSRALGTRSTRVIRFGDLLQSAKKRGHTYPISEGDKTSDTLK